MGTIMHTIKVTTATTSTITDTIILTTSCRTISNNSTITNTVNNTIIVTTPTIKRRTTGTAGIMRVRTKEWLLHAHLDVIRIKPSTQTWQATPKSGCC
jgi:hypothetical protein